MARKLAVLLMAVVLPPAITLAWLGMRLLELGTLVNSRISICQKALP